MLTWHLHFLRFHCAIHFGSEQGSLTARGPAFGDERATVVHQLCGRDASGDRSLGTWMLKSRFTAERAKLLQPRTLPHQSGIVTDTLSQPSRTLSLEHQVLKQTTIPETRGLHAT